MRSQLTDPEAFLKIFHEGNRNNYANKYGYLVGFYFYISITTFPIKTYRTDTKCIFVIFM